MRIFDHSFDDHCAPARAYLSQFVRSERQVWETRWGIIADGAQYVIFHELFEDFPDNFDRELGDVRTSGPVSELKVCGKL